MGSNTGAKRIIVTVTHNGAEVGKLTAVKTMGVPGPSCGELIHHWKLDDRVEYVRDNFSTASFGNNDGSVDWTANYIDDDGEGLGPSAGIVLITGGKGVRLVF